MTKMGKMFCMLLVSFCVLTAAAGQDRLSGGDHFAPVNGIRIHYFVGGEGPVCLVPTPGWGPSLDYLKNSLTPFEKYFTMVYYDTRLSGQSTGPDDPAQYTSRDMMNDMDSLRVYLGLKKIWILGHSSGGFQVLNYGIHHSDKLNGIIALNAVAGSDSLRTAESRKVIMKHRGRSYFEAGAAILLGEDTTSRSGIEKMQYTLPFYFHDQEKIADFQKLKPEVSARAQQYSEESGMGQEYLFPELHRITVPVLVVVGEDDFVCDKVSQSDRIAANICNSTEIVIREAGHFCWVEQPGQFFSECGAWLRKKGLKEKTLN